MKVRKCKKCGQEIRSSTKVCLKCGKDQRIFIKRHPIICIVFVIIAILAIFTGKDYRETDILETNTSNLDEKNLYNVGEVYENGFVNLQFVSINDRFKRYNQYAEIESQHKVIEYEFQFRNVSEIDRLISSDNFYCYADGKKCDMFHSVEDSSFSTILSAGKKINKKIYFEVPLQAKEIIIEFETKYGSGESVKFVAKSKENK